MRNGRGRFIWGGLLFAWSLLAVLRAPTYHLWMFALAATEWGHWLAGAALLPLIPGWGRTAGGRAGAALGLAAALLFLSPLARAARGFSPGDALAQELAAAFGALPAPRALPGAPARAEPFSYADMVRGVASPDVREDAVVYARDCGGALRLQLYRPMKADGPLPVVMVVHGGSWKSGTRLEMSDLSRYLAARGYAVASLDYGLAPDTTFPGPVEDVRDAAAFLRGHAAEWGLDAGRVVLLGRSAGAQIALAAAAGETPLPGLRGVVDFYGPNDLYLAWREPGSPLILDSRALLLDYMGGTPGDQSARYDLASPLLRAGKDFPPTLMIHGTRDELVWPLHELRLSARLKALGVPHYYLELPWATHGCDYAFSGPCGQITTFAVERFLARTLPPRG